MITSKSIDSNKKTVRRLYEECLNKKNLSLLDELIAADYPGFNGIPGPAGFAANIQPLLQAFPDIAWTIEDIIEEGNLIVARTIWKGSHTAAFQTFLPTNKQVAVEVITIYKLKDSKIIHSWIQIDRLGFLQQIGVIPENLALLPQKEKQED